MHFYGQNNLDNFIYQKYFLNKTNGTYIECGAFDGIIDSNTLFFNKHLNWSGYNFEPLPNIFQHLQNNRKNDINLNLALSDKTGTAIFTQAIAKDVPYYDGHFGNGSLNHTEQHINELNNRNCIYEKYTVNTITISDFYKKYNVQNKIDLFILDVEGHEPNVLSLLKEVDEKLIPSVIAVEYNHCGESEIFKHLYPLGYRLNYKDTINLVFSK
jgi:FkbM family methyltransferase